MSAREMARMYEKLAETLSGKHGDIMGYYVNLSNGLESVNSNLTDGPGEAEGKILTDFLEKEAEWRGKYQTILMRIQNGLATLGMRISSAKSLANYWKMQAEIEEKKNGGF